MAQSIPDFNDTAVAFKHLTHYELRRAYWLFKVIGKPIVVAMGPVMTDIAIKLHLPIQSLIKSTVFAHFCGGETIKESLKRVDELAEFHVGTILDFAREGEGKESDFDAVETEIIRTIEEAAQHGSIPFAVFKPSGIGSIELLTKVETGTGLTPFEEAAFQRVHKRFENICSYAANKNVRIMVDAEESWFQNTVDALAKDMMQKYNKQRAIVFNTIQMYRHDRLAFLKEAFAAAEQGHYFLGVKLVRGAYMEKENRRAVQLGTRSPIYASKELTDNAYDDALTFCMDHVDRIAVCAGTHNEKSVKHLAGLMQKQNFEPHDSRIHFAQLLGMSDNLSFNLAAKDYNVAKYVPYGTVNELLPYLTRRAQENSSVLGQTSRELNLLSTEVRRRGLKR
ncbi:MAG: proline dehydrogenase family protein [Chitinophagaceae bacterium]|nr:proline dehydrogenase family protein [Oligoflexus sp.]